MLTATDTRLFYWINHHHNPFLDWVLWVASQGWSWAIVLIAASLYLILSHRKQSSLTHHPSLITHHWSLIALFLLLGIGLCFLLSDRISVLCFKDVFCRLRPCHALDDVRMFRTSCGGQYGFVSSHAANVFALALFLTLFQKKFSIFNSRFSILLFAWACVVCYSRPYLGKHYPGDVICGALLGLLVGAVVFFIVQGTEKLISKKRQEKKSTLS